MRILRSQSTYSQGSTYADMTSTRIDGRFHWEHTEGNKMLFILMPAYRLSLTRSVCARERDSYRYCAPMTRDGHKEDGIAFDVLDLGCRSSISASVYIWLTQDGWRYAYFKDHPNTTLTSYSSSQRSLNSTHCNRQWQVFSCSFLLGRWVKLVLEPYLTPILLPTPTALVIIPHYRFLRGN